jgi:hypothetical protein
MSAPISTEVADDDLSPAQDLPLAQSLPSADDLPPSVIRPEPAAELPVSPELPPPPPAPRRWQIPTGTLPLLAILFGAGLIVLIFAFRTVHSIRPAEFITRPEAVRTRFSITYWIDHGYFASYGILVRPRSTPPGYHFYKSSTGGHMVPGYLLQKTVVEMTGRPKWRLLALHNQLWTLFIASVIGLLGFRLAQRLGAHPLHALAMAIAVQSVHFTFPDNLALYYEMNGRPYFLLFAAIFLLIEERTHERRTRVGTIAQGAAAFLLVYMEYVAGAAFLASYVVVTLLLTRAELPVRRLLGIAVLPAVLAVSVFGMQRSLVRAAGLPTDGSEFLFRTGLDGSATYYGDHLDIALGRDQVRVDFPHNRPYLFRWKWLFFASTAAVLMVLFMAMKDRVPTLVTASLLSLLGAYLLYAALFSQAVKIHPYLFDVLLFTPLVLALFVLAPSLIESMTERRGVAVAIIFFLAVWVSMVQLRRYAMQYPQPPKTGSAALPAPGVPHQAPVLQGNPTESFVGKRSEVRYVTAASEKKSATMPGTVTLGIRNASADARPKPECSVS